MVVVSGCCEWLLGVVVGGGCWGVVVGGWLL